MRVPTTIQRTSFCTWITETFPINTVLQAAAMTTITTGRSSIGQFRYKWKTECDKTDFLAQGRAHYLRAGEPWELARYRIEESNGMHRERRGASSDQQREAGCYVVGYFFLEWSRNSGVEGDSLDQIPDDYVMQDGDQVVVYRKVLEVGKRRYIPPAFRVQDGAPLQEHRVPLAFDESMNEEEKLAMICDASHMVVVSPRGDTHASHAGVYRCHMCGEEGHMRRNCPLKYRVAMNPTGIPRDQLLEVDPDRDGAKIGRSRLYHRDGKFYIHVVNSCIGKR